MIPKELMNMKPLNDDENSESDVVHDKHVFQLRALRCEKAFVESELSEKYDESLKYAIEEMRK